MDAFRRFACHTSALMGTHWAFVAAVVLVVGWALTGPWFHFSEAWQLVMNTVSSVVTFLMVFLIQRS